MVGLYQGKGDSDRKLKAEAEAGLKYSTSKINLLKTALKHYESLLSAGTRQGSDNGELLDEPLEGSKG